MEHQQENKHEQSEYLFSPDVTTTKSRSAKHGNGKAVGFWSDKRVGNSNRDCPFSKMNRNANWELKVFTMKKIITVTLCIVLVLLFAGCEKNGDTSEVEIDYGASSVYSKEEIDSAIEIIKKQFASFEGCELHSLSYMPDEECNNADNIEWMNDLRTDDNKEAFTQCIAFESSFRSPKKGGGAWEANEEYTWSWWLARSEGGEWNLMTWGY